LHAIKSCALPAPHAKQVFDFRLRIDRELAWLAVRPSQPVRYPSLAPITDRSRYQPVSIELGWHPRPPQPARYQSHAHKHARRVAARYNVTPAMPMIAPLNEHVKAGAAAQ
jgi:hypothetical protein